MDDSFESSHRFSLAAIPRTESRNCTTEETALKISHLQAKLNQKLGPEFISERAGPGGVKLSYIEGWKIINIANEVFGFNGWSTQIVSMTTDFLDQDPQTGKYNICVTAHVRVSLRDGTFHEDVGHGHMENCRSKADAIEKAKKEAVTDATKRAIRFFGNLMGNCLYDKNFNAKVKSVKKEPYQFDSGNLHRSKSTNPTPIVEETRTAAPVQAAPPPKYTESVAGPSTKKPDPVQLIPASSFDDFDDLDGVNFAEIDRMTSALPSTGAVAAAVSTASSSTIKSTSENSRPEYRPPAAKGSFHFPEDARLKLIEQGLSDAGRKRPADQMQDPSRQPLIEKRVKTTI